MRHIRLTLSILIAGIALTALFVGLRGFGLLEKSSLARVKSVPRGDREIAWFHLDQPVHLGTLRRRGPPASEGVA
jgi:uncharacterized membrane protein YbhN (UPF0104 family)